MDFDYKAKVKEIAKGRGFTLRDIAEKLGTTEQNLGQRLKRSDVGIGFLLDISLTMGIPEMDFFRALFSKPTDIDYKGKYTDSLQQIAELQLQLAECLRNK